MSIVELKEEIINKVKNLDDTQKLHDILNLIAFNSEQTYVINQQEKAAIDKGLQDLDSGRTYSSEEADKQLKKWLEK